MSIFILTAAIIAPEAVWAGPDRYVGDTAIYGASSAQVNPNVLFILDNSGSMDDTIISGSPYDPNVTYPQSGSCGGQPCATNTVYRCTAFGLECGNWTAAVADVNSVTTSCGGTNPREKLLTIGWWNSSSRRLDTDGACRSGSGIYALGNRINWRDQVGPARPKIDIAREVITSVVNSTVGVNFGVMVFNNNQGGRLLSYNGYTAGVKDMDAIFSGSTTNRDALVAAVNSVTADSWTPLAETLFEAMRYYQGGTSAFNAGTTYTSPITAGCQQNYVVLVTDGMSTQDRDNVLQTICTNGDCDGDGFEPANDPAKSYPNQGSDYLDDVAKYMYSNDMSSLQGGQSVSTFTVGFGLGGGNAGAVKLLNETAANGGGQAFLSENQAQLTDAITQILGQIFEVDTSFVAPVVPVSPENRTYSGSRVYLGFFKPESNKPWLGNLKKYGINSDNDVVDKNNVVATNSDGSFKSTAVSYWSSSSDGGTVESGGAGQLLKERSAARDIYTYMGTSTSLTNSTNALTTGNSAITATTLDVSTSTDKDKLIGFVSGTDSYDDDGDADVAKNREWPLGDILHSKPLIVNYASYAFSAANEEDCNVNKSMIYVGANDGMLHAFKDCDGSEAWAFIPPDSLPRLKYLREPSHSYFVDSSPVVYTYDADKDGNIESGDKVIIVFGQRRGGGSDSSPTGGFYYALDVSDPTAPVYMWKLGNSYSPSGTHADYSEMGETWSEPTIVKVKIGTVDKLVAFVGAGYDNLNEDSRYGATQTFSGTGTVTTNDLGDGAVTSTGTSAPVNPKGRGVYAVEIATLDSSGVPSFTNSGYKVWGYTNATNSALGFSFASEVSAMDFDYNGYVDRLYIPDTGGNLWKFSVGDTNTANWTALKLFASNPGSGGASDKGRKMFFRPSVVREPTYTMLYLGSGDREHPLNRNVVDRLYAVKDNAPTSTVTESDLTDVTLDTLQVSEDTGEINSVQSSLITSSGWYIKLDQNSGEKVVAKSLVFSKAAHYTTHTPNAAPSADPCQPGNLGTGRIYVVDYLTGESVVNYDTANDSSSTTNSRATATEGQVLQRSDRVKTLGSGMPSGVVAIISASGESAIMVGIGGGLAMPETKSGSGIVRIYWRVK